MPFDIYEDPESNLTKTKTMESNGRRPLPLGRTPLGKRTNRGPSDNNGKRTQEPSEHKNNSKQATTTSNQPKEKTHSRTVRFGEMSDSENDGIASTVKTMSTPKTLGEFRRSLGSSLMSNTPATPAPEKLRSIPISPHTLLLEEMESTPDDSFDSLLLSPSGGTNEPVPRPNRTAIPRNSGKSVLSQQSQRILTVTTSTEYTGATSHANLAKKPASGRAAIEQHRPEVHSKKPNSTAQVAIRQSLSEKNFSTGEKPNVQSKNLRVSSLSKRVPSTGIPPKLSSRPADKSTAANSNTVGHRDKTTIFNSNSNTRSSESAPNQPLMQRKENTIELKQTEAEKTSQENARVAISSQNKFPHQASSQLRVSTQLLPEQVSRAPLTYTSQASAWKGVHSNDLTDDSSLPCTPGGVCLDLSSMFHKAQSRPRTKETSSSVTAKLIQDLGSLSSKQSQVPAELKKLHAEQQCEMFTSWMNATMNPDDDVHPEHNPWQGLAVHQRMTQTRQLAKVVWQSHDMQRIRQAIEREVNKGKLQLRSDRDMHADLTQRKVILELLMGSYETPWLRLGLETMFGEHIEPKTQQTATKFAKKPLEKTKLSRMQVALRDFIVNRVLFDKDVLVKYTKGKCKVPSGQFGVQYKAEMRILVLYRVMVLFFFIDHAKQANLLERILFQRQSPQKSSKDMLAAFCRLFLAQSGDIVKQFQRVGLRVQHVQVPLDEIDFTVKNMATDLLDGVRLARLTEVLTSSTYQSVLKQLRIPANSRLQKIHNVNLVVGILGMTFALPKGVTGYHVVDGNREKVLELLWSLVAHFCLPYFLKTDLVLQEILRIKSTRGDEMNSHDPSRLASLNKHERMFELILQWANTVLFAYNVHVSNLSWDWADGVPCCLLISYYHPELLDLKDIRFTDRPNFVFGSKSAKKISQALLRQQERENWELAGKCMSQLGTMAVLPQADSDCPPQERTTLMGLAFLCHRLLESRIQVQACRLLQRVVRRKQRLRDLHAKISAAVLIEKVWWRHKDTYYRNRRTKYASAVSAIETFISERLSRLEQLRELRLQNEKSHSCAILIQAQTRRFIARSRYCYLVECRRNAVASLQAWWHQMYVDNIRQRASTKIQTKWRMFWAKMQYILSCFDIVDVQRCARRFLARQESRSRRWAVGVIQRTSRNYLCQKKSLQHSLQERSVTLIQKSIRGFLIRLDFKTLMQRYRASRAIQSSWRRHTKQSSYDKMRNNVTSIQTAVRRYLVETFFTQCIESVVVLQAFWRSKSASLLFKVKVNAVILLQRNARKWRSEQQACSKINTVLTLQCFFRSVKSRQISKSLLAQKEFAACQMIQSCWRTRKVLRDFHKAREALVLIQSNTRRWILHKSFHKRRAAVTVVQCAWRSLSVRSRFLFTRRKIVVCQSVARTRIVKAMHRLQINAAVALQSQVRMWQAKMLVRTAIDKLNRDKMVASVSIQKEWRSYFARCRFQRSVHTAVRLQAISRMFLSRTRHCKASVASVVIQKQYRMHRAIKELSLLTLAKREKLRREAWAATCLQCWIRCSLTRRSFVRQQQAAIHVQTQYRGFVAEKNFKSTVRSVKLAQTLIRKFLVKEEARVRRNALLLIQSVVRMHEAVKRASQIRQENLEGAALISIQCFFRSLIAKKLYMETKKLHDAAVVIQIAFRSYTVSYKAACMIQKTYRAYRDLATYFFVLHGAIIPLQALLRRRIALQESDIRRYAIYVLQNFAKRTVEHQRQIRYVDCISIVQSRIRGHLVRQRQASRQRCAKIVQRCVRGYFVRNAMHRRRMSACQIQRIVRGFIAYADYMFSRLQVIKIQNAFRRCREMLRELIENREKHACIKLQSLFRGYLARRDRKRLFGPVVGRELRKIVCRLAKADVSPHLLLGNRLAEALRTLRTSNSLEEVLMACKTLKYATQFPKCSTELVKKNAIEHLFDWLQKCNRSPPHVELKTLIVCTLLNVYKHCGLDTSWDCAGIICLDQLQSHRSKELDLCVLVASLLCKVVRSSQRAREQCAAKENLKRLKDITRLCQKQLGMHSRKTATMQQLTKKLRCIIETIEPKAM